MPAPERLRPHRPIPAAAKTGAKAATRPRVLCLINSRPELMAYTEALKGLGEFLPLEDPVEAIEIVARFQPDIVYMNIVAEAYSGLQLAQLFRSNPRLAHIEVVFLFTGRETPAQLQAAQRLTSNPQLRSPITSDQARATLQAIIAKPGFKVRQKKLGYGAYVDEVLRKEREKHEEERKKREKAFYEEKHEDLVVGIQEALRNFRPDPAHEALVTKNLQAYYLEE
jgi:CheY-like chemotaxis protein